MYPTPKEIAEDIGNQVLSLGDISNVELGILQRPETSLAEISIVFSLKNQQKRVLVSFPEKRAQAVHDALVQKLQDKLKK